jgi:hypothetical protein
MGVDSGAGVAAGSDAGALSRSVYDDGKDPGMGAFPGTASGALFAPGSAMLMSVPEARLSFGEMARPVKNNAKLKASISPGNFKDLLLLLANIIANMPYTKPASPKRPNRASMIIPP